MEGLDLFCNFATTHEYTHSIYRWTHSNTHTDTRICTAVYFKSKINQKYSM